MIAIIDCGSNRVCDISRIVGELGYENEVFLMEDLTKKEGLCKGDFARFDGIIISGSPLTLTNENKEKYLKLFPFIGEIDSPILGICFGHQTIGHVLGASYCIDKMIKGDNEIHIINKKEPLFAGIKTGSLFRESHEQHIMLPPDFILLADSDNCKNEAMKHKSKPIYGVQFHPEISGEVGKKLIGNFLKMC